jgi:hypothetical protein
LLEFFAGNNFAWTIEQERKDVKWLLLYLEFQSILAKLGSIEVHLEEREANNPVGHARLVHAVASTHGN